VKKQIARFIVFLVLTGAPLFAADSQNMTIGIQGFGNRVDQVTFFREAFMAEAAAAGFKIAEQFDFKYADYGIRFDITPNTNVNEQQFIFTISLVRIKDLATMVAATYAFNELEEMVPYTQYLFFRIVANIPGYGTARENSAWKNKWLYLRLSFDYPITVYELQSNGLAGGAAVYKGEDINDPANDIMLLDNKVMALPGATLGLECQFLDWMSAELGVSVAMEELFSKNYYYTMTAELELKFPIKTTYLMFEPYAAASYPFLIPDRFAEFPRFSVGGGLQLGFRGGSLGAFFVDINYMHSFQQAVMNNPFGEQYPNPDKIYYRRFLVGLGVGYKIGFLNRK